MQSSRPAQTRPGRSRPAPPTRPRRPWGSVERAPRPAAGPSADGGRLTGSGLVLLFLDGVGLGEPDPTINPLFAAATPVLDALLGTRLVTGATELASDSVVFRRLDATMGHDGLPQSATGQTAILTGVNAAEVMNGHYGPWPGPTLKRVIDRGSLFALAQRAGGATLANAFPPGYFAAMSGRRYRPNANAYAATAAGVELRGQAEFVARTGVPSDLDGAAFASLGGGGEMLGPLGSASVLTELTRTYAFTMLDIWLTDHYGHRGDLEAGRALLERFDEFLGALVDPEHGVVAAGGTVIVTSDHGNIEDLSISSHTRNEVPLIAIGPGAGALAAAASLLDVAPAAASMLGGELVERPHNDDPVDRLP